MGLMRMKTLIALALIASTLQAQAYTLTPWFIRIVQEVTITTDGDCNWHAAYYSDSKSLIAMCSLTLDNLTHEVGHRVWYRYMNDREREIWTILFEHSKLSWDYAREYGKKNVKEDFATIFEAYYWWTLPNSRTEFMEYKVRYMEMLDEKYLNN